MTHKIRGVRVDKYDSYVSTLRQNVGLENEYDVKLWRHKDRIPNENAHHIPLNETLPMKIFCVRHWSQLPFVKKRRQWIKQIREKAPSRLFSNRKACSLATTNYSPCPDNDVQGNKTNNKILDISK